MIVHCFGNASVVLEHIQRIFALIGSQLARDLVVIVLFALTIIAGTCELYLCVHNTQHLYNNIMC